MRYSTDEEAEALRALTEEQMLAQRYTPEEEAEIRAALQANNLEGRTFTLTERDDEAAPVAVTPPARTPLAVPRDVMVPAQASPPDDFELAAAKAEEAEARRRMALETAARQFVGGVTRTAAPGVLSQPSDAVAQLFARRKAKADEGFRERQLAAQEGRTAAYEAAQDAAGRGAAAKGERERERQRVEEERQRLAAELGRGRLDVERQKAETARLKAEADAKRRAGNPAAAKKAAEEKKARQGFADSSALRKEFNAQKDVQQFNEVRTSYEKIRSAAENPSAAGDLALIFGYMKMLDPGSTVREGEFANAQNAAGVPDRIVNAYNNTLRGERLNPVQRKDFISSSERAYAAHKKAYEQQASRYRTLATKAGVDPDDVTGGTGGQPQAQAGRVVVRKGDEVLEIDAADLEAALADGYEVARE